MDFIKKKIQIRNSQGLHARPASIFVKIANKFESEVTVRKDDETVSGKSIMGLLTLAANQGSTIEIEVSGPDAEQAMKELEAFLMSDEGDMK
ncbi:MAG TPA: HPr family phosphocarrier protein [Candidatus Eisenbacteria bacterium]|nr:HPr family phosphocarrier protein [Candidatus Eisenbacteria bacterium]